MTAVNEVDKRVSGGWGQCDEDGNGQVGAMAIGYCDSLADSAAEKCSGVAFAVRTHQTLSSAVIYMRRGTRKDIVFPGSSI